MNPFFFGDVASIPNVSNFKSFLFYYGFSFINHKFALLPFWLLFSSRSHKPSFCELLFHPKDRNFKLFLFHPKTQTLDCSILWLFSSQKPQTLGPSFGAIFFIQNQTLGPFFFELFSSDNHKLDVQTFLYCCFHLKTHKPKVVPFVVIIFIQKS